MRRVIGTFSKLTTSPAAGLALDLDQVKLQRRVGSSTTMDALFEIWITAAASLFEEQTGRAVMIEPYQYRLDCPPPVDRFIEIPKAPLVAVTAITYLPEGSEDEATFSADNYDVITPVGLHCAPGRIVLKAGASWPTCASVDGAFRIAITAGYAETAADVPPLVQACLMFLVGHFHKYGEEVIGGTEAGGLQTLPLGATTMIRAFRDSALPTQAPWEVPWLG